MADPLIGKTVGEFVVREVLGRGGMAVVYLAWQESMRREVALKVIRMDDLENNHEFTQRFATEAKLIAALEDPHILPVYSHGIDGDIAYLAMRLLRGGSLEDLMKGEPLTLQRAGELFVQICKGLAAAHNKGVIHRDLKPSNILMDDNGHVYLTDFGLAKLVDSEGYQTKTGQIVGTPLYMSPEQLRGEPLDFRSDVYALGCMLYQMLTGTPPFPITDGDVIPVIFKHLQSPPDPVSTRNRNIPPTVEAVVMKALAKDRNERYDSVRSMANVVAEAIGHTSNISLPRPASEILNLSKVNIVRQEEKKPNRAPLFIGLGALVAAIVLVVFRPFDNLTPLPPITVVLGESRPLSEFEGQEINQGLVERRLGSEGFVAIVPCNTSSEYHAALTREITTFARQVDLPTRVYDPDSDSYKQLTQIEKAITDGAVGIIICPLDLSLLSDTFQAIKDAGIPMVSTASTLGQYNGVGVLIDNYLLGLAPGQYAGQWIRDNLDGQARVLVLHYDELPDVKRRAEGMIDGMLEFAPDAQIVAREIGGIVENGEAAIEKLVANGIEFDVILTINDAGAYGAVDAMQDAGISPEEVHIFSVDAEVRARQLITEGEYFLASVDAGRTVFAEASVEVMRRLLAGEALPEILTHEPGDLITPEFLAQNGNS
jgi:serine/threonine protein kinase